MKLYLRNNFRNTLKNKGSYLGAIFVIAMGLLVFVAMTDVIFNLDDALEKYYNETKFADIFATVEGIPENKLAELEEIEGIDLAFGRLSKDIRAFIDGQNNLVTLHVMAFDESDRLNLFKMETKNLSSQDLFLGDKMFQEYGFEKGDEIDLIIGNNAETFILQGTCQQPEHIYSIPPGGAQTPDSKIYDIACMDKIRLEELLGQDNMSTELGFTLENGYDYDDVKQELTDRLTDYGLSTLVEREKQTSNNMMDSEFSQLSAVAAVLPAIFLSAAAFMLYITLRKLIEKDRTLIGTMKAFGFSDMELVYGYMKQGIVIGIIGSIIGSILSMPFTKYMFDMYIEYYNLPVDELKFYMSTRGLGMLIAVAVSMFSVYVSMKTLLQVNPAEAMRPAAPKETKGIRLPDWLNSMMNAKQKMSARFMMRNQMRTFLMIFSVAFPFALTAVMFSYDTLAQQIFIDQFTKIETYDMKAALDDYASYNRVVADTSNIDGVYDVEAIASYAVTFQHENMTQLASLTALNPYSDNFRIVDIYDRVYQPRSDGLILNSITADKLNVQAGDELEVRNIYLAPEAVKIPVVQIVEECFGNGGYLDISAMQKYFNIGNLSNTVLFKVEPNQTAAVKDVLIDTKEVISLTESEQALKNYQVLMESMSSMMYMFSLLSVMMGFILIYNIMNISLRERQTEFGTLMVLGTSEKDLLEIVSFEHILIFLSGIVLGYPMSLGLKEIVADIIATDVYTVHFVVPFSSYVIAFVICGLIMVLATRIIFKNIRRLEPSDVLKERE